MSSRAPADPFRPHRVRIAGLLLMAVVGCVETVTLVGEGDIVDLLVSPDSTIVGVGRTVQVVALPIDDGGGLIVGQGVAWSSTNAAVATVDDTGLVTGVAPGMTQIVALIAGLEARADVTVDLPPRLDASADTVRFAAEAGGADPTPAAVDITNGGGFSLVGLSVDSVTYGPAGQGWLSAVLSSTQGPATLDLTASVTGLSAAGVYTASVWLSATDADSSPFELVVELDLGAGPASAMALNDGDGQTATAGTAVPIAPSALVTDASGNPVSGVQVTFSPTAGGGGVTGAVGTTDASGVARVGSWTLGGTAGPNMLEATAAGLPTVTYTATGVAGPAVSLEIDAGDAQSAVAGAAVAISPAAVALDAFDNPVAGVSVAFSVVSGGGSITGSPQTTNASGVATSGTWTLGGAAGPNGLRAVAVSIPDSVDFTATGLSGQAAAIQEGVGDAQIDTVAATLGVYTVRIVDSGGNGVAGIPVSWSVTGGGGSIDPSSTTDATGFASATRVLGTTPGPHTAEAAVGGLTGSPIVFTATALVGAPAIVSVGAGDGQIATVNTAVTDAPQVIVTDQFANPIQGHSVTFSVTGGGGAVAPTGAVLTAADGTATATSWTLGTMSGAGNNTVQALAAGGALTGNPQIFTATATADAPAAIGIQPGSDGQTAVSGTAVAVPPTVVVTDQFGNGVPGETVNFSASGAGSVGSPSPTTDPNGEASTSWTVDVGSSSVDPTDGTFPNTLDADVQGTVLSTRIDADAIYSYATHVDPIWGPAASGCTGCHFGATPPRGLALDQGPVGNLADLRNVGGGCAALDRVDTRGGTAGANTFSLIMILGDPGLTNPGTCGHFATLDAGDRQILRAWIQNMAPDN